MYVLCKTSIHSQKYKDKKGSIVVNFLGHFSCDAGRILAGNEKQTTQEEVTAEK